MNQNIREGGCVIYPYDRTNDRNQLDDFYRRRHHPIHVKPVEPKPCPKTKDGHVDYGKLYKEIDDKNMAEGRGHLILMPKPKMDPNVY